MKLLVKDTDDQEWVTTAYHQLHDQLHGELNDWLNNTNIYDWTQMKKLMAGLLFDHTSDPDDNVNM